MLRLFSAAALALCSTGMFVAATPSVSADPLCASANTTGSLGMVEVNQVCVPYPFAAECNSTTVHVLVQYVTENSCVPAP